MFVLSREEMYQYDNYTINVSGIPGEELMENAGKGCSEIIHKEILAEKGKVVIFCGSGNNGGDGFVIARYLRQWGHQVVVVLTGDQENMSPETQVNFQKCLTMKISWCHVTSIRAWQEAKIQLAEFDLIIDAIFGVGLKAPLRGWWGELIEIMNKASVLKVSVDIPSGVDANTGYSPHAFCADHTLTMANYKYGHLIETGRLCSGEVKIIDIGIDPAVYEKFPPRGRMITEEDVVYPSRSRFHHKGGYGRIAIIGGSPGYSGAAIMACQAALRAGAGLITLFHPPGMELIFESQLLEVMTFSLPVDNAEKLDWDTLERKLDQNDVILIGPGMGTGKTATRLVEYVVKNWRKPLVLDADALNIVSRERKLLTFLENRLLLPHVGEFSRLAALEIEKLVQNPLLHLREFCNTYRCAVLLKSVTSILYDRESIVFNISGNDGLATGGSGDVLAGITVSFAGQKLPLPQAAISASYLMGKTAEKIAEYRHAASIIPSDIIDALFRF